MIHPVFALYGLNLRLRVTEHYLNTTFIEENRLLNRSQDLVICIQLKVGSLSNKLFIAAVECNREIYPNAVPIALQMPELKTERKMPISRKLSPDK